MNKVLDISVVVVAGISLVVSIIVGLNVIESSNQNIELMKNINKILEKNLLASEKIGETVEKQYDLVSFFEVREASHPEYVQLEAKHMTVDGITKIPTQHFLLTHTHKFSFDYISNVPLSFKIKNIEFKPNPNHELNRKCLLENDLKLNNLQEIYEFLSTDIPKTEELRNIIINVPVIFTGTLRDGSSVINLDNQTSSHRITLGELIYMVIASDKSSQTNQTVLVHKLFVTNVSTDTFDQLETCRKNVS